MHLQEVITPRISLTHIIIATIPIYSFHKILNFSHLRGHVNVIEELFRSLTFPPGASPKSDCEPAVSALPCSATS